MTDNKKTIIELFQKPDLDAKGMFRCWYPDAGADLKRVKAQVLSVYEAGFGGMEIAMVPQFVDFDPKEYGWGTKRWKEIMKTILRTAAGLPEKFIIDFTITAHWPPSLNTILPNHPAAMKELSFAYQKITAAEKICLPIPETRTSDNDGNEPAAYTFKENFIAATIGKVLAVEKDQMQMEMESMEDVTHLVSKCKEKETGEYLYTPAGIPFAEESFGTHKKLLDRQYCMEIDGTGWEGKLHTHEKTQSGNGECFQTGDWILFAHYYRGTGQTLSGRDMDAFCLKLPMAGKMYAVDYYSTEGTNAITDYWNETFLADEELRGLLEASAGAIFEDSIETPTATSVWTNRYLENFKELRGYDLVKYLPFIQSIKGSKVKFTTKTETEQGIMDDYFRTLNDLYIRNHILRIQDWTKTFHHKYRAQSYGGCVNTSTASVVLDIAEGESLGFGTFYDYFRNITGGVHMSGRKLVSDEALADIAQGYCLNWKSAAHTLNQNYAAGVNRVIVHGMSYEEEVSGNYNQWPGWHAFQRMFADPWGERQTYWEYVSQMADYIARTQSVLQNGIPVIDVCIYKNEKHYGRGYEEILDYGYTYDIISTTHVLLPEIRVEGRRLYSQGAEYGAMIVKNQKGIPIEAANKFLELAKAGFSIIFTDQIPSKVQGAFEDSKPIEQVMEEIMQFPNVRFVESGQVLQALGELKVQPAAAYVGKGLRSYCRRDKTGIYYFLFNSSAEPFTSKIILDCSGVPAILNAWTGNISVCYDYGETEDGIWIKPSLEAGEAIFVGVMASSQNMEGLINTKGNKKGYLPWIFAERADLWIESWGPSKDAPVATLSEKTMLEIGSILLKPWDEIGISGHLLQKAGVAKATQISGIGIYQTEILLEEQVDGAEIYFEHGNDMVVKVIVNGVVRDSVDQATSKVDVQEGWKKGVNTLKAVLATTLVNRAEIENKWLVPVEMGPPPEGATAGGEMEAGMPLMGQVPDSYHYGITKIACRPYQWDIGETVSV